MRSIFGVTFDEKFLKSFSEDFTLVRDLDEESYYESNKTYHHEEEGLSFDYKYVILVSCRENDDEKLFMNVSLYLAPTFDSLCEKTKLEMVSSWGINNKEELANAISKCGVSCGEVAEEGYGVYFIGESYEAPNGWGDLDKSMLDDIASVIEPIDDFRGFYVDRMWNRIGTTGWDTIRHDIKGEELFKF